jgi:hypothetical protein
MFCRPLVGLGSVQITVTKLLNNVYKYDIFVGGGKQCDNCRRICTKYIYEEVKQMSKDKDGVRLNGEGVKDGKHRLPRILWLLVAVLAILVVGLSVKMMSGKGISFHLGNFNFSNKKEEKVTTITQSDIEEVFEISELQTAEYVYNAIVAVYSDDGKKVKYYASYEGTVTAGINFNDIAIDIDEENKEITLTVPEVSILDISVKNLEFIFTNKKYNDKDTYNEALLECNADLNERVESDEKFLNMAKENTNQVVGAMVSPWVSVIDAEFKVTVR